jgi:hypothetical protein
MNAVLRVLVAVEHIVVVGLKTYATYVLGGVVVGLFLIVVVQRTSRALLALINSLEPHRAVQVAEHCLKNVVFIHG